MVMKKVKVQWCW